MQGRSLSACPAPSFSSEKIDPQKPNVSPANRKFVKVTGTDDWSAIRPLSHLFFLKPAYPQHLIIIRLNVLSTQPAAAPTNQTSRCTVTQSHTSATDAMGLVTTRSAINALYTVTYITISAPVGPVCLQQKLTQPSRGFKGHLPDQKCQLPLSKGSYNGQKKKKKCMFLREHRGSV